MKNTSLSLILLAALTMMSYQPQAFTQVKTKAQIKAEEKAAKEAAKAEKKRLEAEEKERKKREKECRKRPYICPPPPASTTTSNYYPQTTTTTTTTLPSYSSYGSSSSYYYPNYYQPAPVRESDETVLERQISNDYSLSNEERTQLKNLYSQRRYSPVFVTNYGSYASLTAKASELSRALNDIGEYGLHAADYLTPEVQNILSSYQISDFASAEMALAKAFIKASMGLSVGRIDPRLVSADILYAPREFTRWADLNQAFSWTGIKETWNRIEPQNDKYQQLKVVLQRLREIEAQGGFKAINPSGSHLTLGVSGPTVLALKTRAQQLGYVVYSLDNMYDENLAEIVRDIQEANMAPVTGELDPQDYDAWEAFSVTSTRRIQQVELNLEKARWLPENLGEKYLFVNLAKQYLEVHDPNLMNYELKRQRIVGGRFERKTPSMQDRTTEVVINPTWTVPVTIFQFDKLPKIQELLADPINGAAAVNQWFIDNRFVVYNSSMTATVEPATVDWVNINPKLEQYWIQQQPGYNNALGVAKILLANKMSIYLHDTNDRQLLNTPSRLRSSGCMRLQKPLELAEYLLTGTKWNLTTMSELAAKENEIKDKETSIDIPTKNRMPIYIISLTAELGEDNVMRFTRDEYKQNLDLLTKLQEIGYMK